MTKETQNDTGTGVEGSHEFSEAVVRYAEAAFQNMKGRAIPVVGQLAPFIDNGIYALIVSDDVKGHVPAQLLHLVINSRYYINGFPYIDLLHIRGRFVTRSEEIAFAFQNQAGITDFSSGQKFLLATESIGSGRTIGRFGKAFSELGVPYDIVSFVVSRSEGFYRRHRMIGRDVQLIHPNMPDDNAEFVDQCQLMSAAFYPDRSFGNFEMAVSYYTQTRLPAIAKEVLAEVF